MGCLPAWAKYPITVFCFYPTILATRLYCFLNTRLPSILVNGRVRLFNRITPSIVLGVAPVFLSDVEELYGRENIRHVINLCREWNPHASLYAEKGITQTFLPTIDFEPPTLEATLQGLAAIEAAKARGESVYVHCKAGRGRSVCIVLAYLVMKEGFTPPDAELFLLSKRCNIARLKWKLPLFTELVRLKEAEAAAAAGSLTLRAGSPSPPKVS